MVSLFRPDAPVLHFGLRIPRGDRPPQRRYLLWPALVYRVVAPEIRERALNVIQRAVLGMCRAGTTGADRIGARLRIHPDLAALVYLELQQRMLIDDVGCLTKGGRDIFEEETLESHRLVTGHVFQDPWTGEMWPRFVERLDYVELARRPNGFPDLILGSRGRPRRESAFMYVPRGAIEQAVPLPADVLRATRRHRASLRGTSFEQDGDNPVSPHAGGTAIDRVSLIDTIPTPAFVTTALYLLPGGAAGEWDVRDPFSLGDSGYLRRAFDREAATDGRLLAVLEGMLGTSLKSQVEHQRRWVADVHLAAEQTLDKLFSVNVRDLPEYTALLELTKAHAEADLLAEQCPEQKLRDVLVAARRTLEASFQAMASKHGVANVWRPFFTPRGPIEDRAFLEAAYTAAARQIGFAVPLPRALATVKPGILRSVCGGNGWRLRPSILAATLAASRNRAHPLWRAATLDPGLLACLDGIANSAGEAAHATTTRPSLKDLMLEVSNTVASTHHAVALMSGLVSPRGVTPSGS